MHSARCLPYLFLINSCLVSLTGSRCNAIIIHLACSRALLPMAPTGRVAATATRHTYLASKFHLPLPFYMVLELFRGRPFFL